jgi:hypothetical protein
LMTATPPFRTHQFRNKKPNFRKYPSAARYFQSRFCIDKIVSVRNWKS